MYPLESGALVRSLDDWCAPADGSTLTLSYRHLSAGLTALSICGKRGTKVSYKAAVASGFRVAALRELIRTGDRLLGVGCGEAIHFASRIEILVLPGDSLCS